MKIFVIIFGLILINIGAIVRLRFFNKIEWKWLILIMIIVSIIFAIAMFIVL
jgi:hypothetical protein